MCWKEFHILFLMHDFSFLLDHIKSFFSKLKKCLEVELVKKNFKMVISMSVILHLENRTEKSRIMAFDIYVGNFSLVYVEMHLNTNIFV